VTDGVCVGRVESSKLLNCCTAVATDGGGVGGVVKGRRGDGWGLGVWNHPSSSIAVQPWYYSSRHATFPPH
jgi:hypothetical protein